MAAFKAKYLDHPAGIEGPARQMTPFITEQLREQFAKDAVRQLWGPPRYSNEEYRSTFRVRLVKGGESIRCPFTQDEVTQMWNDAHKHAFELVEKLLLELKEWTSRPFNGAVHDPCIAILGGSAKNVPFRRKMNEMVHNAGLPKAIFPGDAFVDPDSM